MPGQTPSFDEMGLRPVVVHALRGLGLQAPSPIQAAALPDAMAGRDVLGRAPTGSGKTLAFGLPLLHRLSGSSSRRWHPRGLILAPTRELALQIEKALEEPALASGIRIAGVVGGVPMKKQADRLTRGVDVVVATPGRLEDLLKSTELSLDDVAISVVDEADRMADLGFLPQVTAILDRTPTSGQRMLFSATLDGEVDGLVARYLHSPAVHHAQPTTDKASEVRHHFLRVLPERKDEVAVAIAARDGSTIVFLRTRHAVDRLTDKFVAAGIPARALHGSKSQADRTHALTAFADGSVPVLVATDVAARGIDVDTVSLVLHVDPPADAKDYTHRAGRTARAGRGGIVVTLATAKQEAEVVALAAEAGIEVEFRDVGAESSHLRETTGARTPPGKASTPSERTPRAATGRPRRTTVSRSTRTRRTGRR